MCIETANSSNGKCLRRNVLCIFIKIRENILFLGKYAETYCVLYVVALDAAFVHFIDGELIIIF